METRNIARRRRWPFILATACVLVAIGGILILTILLETRDSLAELKALPLYKGAEAASYAKEGIDGEGRDTSTLTFFTTDPPSAVIAYYKSVFDYPGKELVSPDRTILNVFAVITDHEDVRFRGFESDFPWVGPAFTTKMLDINMRAVEDSIDGRDLTAVSLRYRLFRIK